MLVRFLSFIFLTLFIFPIWADQLIIEPDMGRKPILDAIQNTHHSLDLVMYGFTDQTLLDAILRKKAEGRTVKIILEGSPYKAEGENNKTIAAFNQQDIHWQDHIPPFRLIHQKTLILDDSKAIVMTFNFTHSTFKNERNFALIIDDPKRVNAIAAIFSADWNHISPTNIHPDLIISPDNSRDQLLSLIQHAKTSLQVYAQGLNDFKIVGALANAARRSVDVKIITSTHLRKTQENYLQRAGVNIHYHQGMMIHAKVFIIDHQKAVIGSINLTRASLETNRELSIITRDAQVITQLNETFTRDWGNQIDIHAKKWMTDKTFKHAIRMINKFVNGKTFHDAFK